MLKTWFNQYKWYVVAILFLTYSVGVWNVSGRIKDTVHLRDQVRQQEKFIEIQANNEKLREEISKLLQQNLEANSKAFRDTQKELLDEILLDPRYKSCTTTDRVRNALQRQLNRQSK